MELEHENEMAVVIDLALGTLKDYWIGLSDTEYEGNFLWDRSRGNISDFHAWGNDEPNGGFGENCVSITEAHTYFWSDQDCDDLRTPMCFGNVLVDPCPEGWKLVGTSRTCILVGDGGTTSYSQAKSRCEQKGAWLVSCTYVVQLMPD